MGLGPPWCVKHHERSWEFPVLALKELTVSRLTQCDKVGRRVSVEGYWTQKRAAKREHLSLKNKKNLIKEAWGALAGMAQ